MSGWQPSKSRFGHDGRHEPHSRCGFDWARPFHPPLVRRDGDAVELAVIDNGGGIAEHMLEKVLEPFETTKKDGLGMGLPIVRAIAEQHEGTIQLQNDPGRGLTVSLQVPAWKEGRKYA